VSDGSTVGDHDNGAVLDQDLVDEFRKRAMTDSGAAMLSLTVAIGIRAGLYRAMAGAGWLTPAKLAERAGLVERYVSEWLAAQTAWEYVRYSTEDGTYLLPDEHAAVLADPESPAYAVGAFELLNPLYAAEDKLLSAYKTGEGVGWGEFGPRLASATADFFYPGYASMLVQSWLPAMDGVAAKLENGAVVADVGCGHGHTTLLMARAYPNSTFRGFDFHEPSIEAARGLAAEQGLSGRVSFDVAKAHDFPASGDGYDLITFFDCLHDLGDPGLALSRVSAVLADDGSCLIVEPNASPDPAGNTDLAGRRFAASSVSVCLPGAMAQHGQYALGNHAGEEAVRRIAEQAGLTDWRLVTETIVNRIYQAKR
jgi:ubiquinone/menaquinone biosynthesis C-methylase UbiE